MKNNSSIDIATLNILYKKYKEHIIYLGIIAVCLLIFVFFTIPKISEVSVIGQERKAEEEKLKVLKNNSNILQNTDDSVLDEDLGVVSNALPEGKDFEGILNAISLASSKSGASLKDYDFGVGALSDSETSEAGYPNIKLTLEVDASQAQVVSLLKYLSETVPLSQITGIKKSSGSTSIDMVFYYKSSIPPNNNSENIALTALNQIDNDLISTLSTWRTSFISVVIDPSASISSSTSPF
ncbi:MAG: hypothetical protein AAB521_02645 [Patescibacteria group bacterium]